MPNAGDSFTTTLKRAHLEWGTYRHTSTRGVVYGEGYLQIPISVARRLDIHNSNQPNSNNIYNCTSADGFLNNVQLKAAGSVTAGAIHAKQFQGNGNLQVLGDWFNHVGAVIGDRVEITWINPTHFNIRKI